MNSECVSVRFSELCAQDKLFGCLHWKYRLCRCISHARGFQRWIQWYTSPLHQALRKLRLFRFCLRSQTLQATPRAAASSKKASAMDVIDLGDEDDEEEHSKAARVRATPVKGASAAARPVARVGYSAASAVQLDDDIVDDEGFVQPSAGSSARATQQSALRLPGGTAGKKRQLPLSFSQSANPSQSASRKPAANKSLASGWDD
jgi:hypothetical protein